MTSRQGMSRSALLATLAVAGALGAAPAARGVEFDRIVIDDDFPGAYQVEVADVNGDKRPDVVAVGGATCAWYENPSWKKRIVTGPKQTPGIISSATADLDGDGKAEIAIAHDFEMNEPTRGKLLLATQGDRLDDPWKITQVDDVPSIHRLRWGAIWNRDRLDLVVAPIFGPRAKPPAFDQDPAGLRIYQTGEQPKSGRWSHQNVPGGSYVLHAIEVRANPARSDDPPILTATNLGVFAAVLSNTPQGVLTMAAFNVFPIPTGAAPKRGSSEVHLGRLADGRQFLATIEPWHGTDVVVRFRVPDPPGTQVNLNFGPRSVLDSSLKDGHALWVADVDGDGDDEILAGYRGPGTSVLLFDHDGKSWVRTVVDDAIAAQDLRGGDLDGDGAPDVVAVGGKTHNVVWYKPRKP